jgi:hypothetical protein
MVRGCLAGTDDFINLSILFAPGTHAKSLGSLTTPCSKPEIMRQFSENSAMVGGGLDLIGSTLTAFGTVHLLLFLY